MVIVAEPAVSPTRNILIKALLCIRTGEIAVECVVGRRHEQLIGTVTTQDDATERFQCCFVEVLDAEKRGIRVCTLDRMSLERASHLGRHDGVEASQSAIVLRETSLEDAHAHRPEARLLLWHLLFEQLNGPPEHCFVEIQRDDVCRRHLRRPGICARRIRESHTEDVVQPVGAWHEWGRRHSGNA